jgi:hypothetical protein
MSAAKEVVKSKIKPEVTALSDVFTKAMTLKISDDKKSGVIEIADGAYVDNLPEGINKDMVSKLQAYNSTVAASAALAVGTMANAAIKKNKELDRVTMTLPTVGKDFFEVVNDRSREVRDVSTGNTSIKFGNVSVSHKMYAARARGQLKEVREMLAEQATAMYGK